MYRTCSIPSFLTYESTQYNCYISYNSLYISILQHIYIVYSWFNSSFLHVYQMSSEIDTFLPYLWSAIGMSGMRWCFWLISFCSLQNLSSWKHRRRRASAATYQRVEEVDSLEQEEEDKKKPKTYGEMMADRYKALPIFLNNFF